MSNLVNEESQGAAKATTSDTSASGGTGGAIVTNRSIRDFFRGDLGPIPVLVTLVIVSIYFQFATNGDFLQPANLSNLALQIVTIGTVGTGAVLILLLGEIDLSLAAVSQACAGICGVLIVRQGWPVWLALIAAILIGTVIGLGNGFFIAILRIPSFIVTLAGSLAYAGLLLTVLLPQTTLSVRDPFIQGLATTYLDPIWGIGIPVVGVLVYLAALLYTRNARQKAGLKVSTISGLAVKIGVIVVLLAVVLFIFQSDKRPRSTAVGVPQSTAIWIGLIVIVWLILKQTSFGRHIYAVGGNAEAARRAGINVVGVRIAVFAMASTLTAIAGILQLSRSNAADAAINPTLLLNAIAAAVIGGVSLFGGRGSVWAVVLGALVIGSIENGLNLLNAGQDVKYIVEGIVLVLAVTADALIRRANAVQGR
jgi:D-xylose transport system permease protein